MKEEKLFVFTYGIILYVENPKNYIKMSGFPCGSAGKESACNVGDLGSIPGLGRSPGGRHENTPQYSCLENPPGQKSLVGYSSWGHKK